MVKKAVGRRYRYVTGGRNGEQITDYLHLSSGYEIFNHFQVASFMDVKTTKMITTYFYDQGSDGIFLAIQNSQKVNCYV